MSKSEQTNSTVGPVFELPGKSLRIVKENLPMFLLVNVAAILSAFASAVNPSGNKTSNIHGSGLDYSGISSGQNLAAILGFGIIIGLILAVVAFFLYTMAVGLEVRASKGEKPDANTLFNDGKKYFLRLLGLTILSALIVLVGFILLIVPGVIAISRLAMAPYFMFEKNLSVIDAIKASNENAKGKFSLIWAAILVMILIGIAASIVNAIPFIGPLIGTAIIIAYSLVMVLRYRELQA